VIFIILGLGNKSAFFVTIFVEKTEHVRGMRPITKLIWDTRVKTGARKETVYVRLLIGSCGARDW
jgi:hypothetical protein